MHADSFLLQLTLPDTLSSLDCMHARPPVTAIIIIPMRATEASRLKQIERAALKSPGVNILPRDVAASDRCVSWSKAEAMCG